MGVANMAFLVERLYADCAPGQFVRELTKNGLQALGRLSKQSGKIVWTYDRQMHGMGKRKLVCIDTGVGMSGAEMVKFINALAQSSYVQSAVDNFGVGAKISAAPRNREGMIYLSWKDGVGAMVYLWKNSRTGEYGLRMLSRADGAFDFWAPAPDSLMPKEIREAGRHGTAVILLGNDDNDDTTLMPPGLQMPGRWILRYLNGRFFRFPMGVEVGVHEGWEKHPETDTKRNFVRKVEGLEAWLNAPKRREVSNSVHVTGATIHWWILKADADLDSGHAPTPGLVAALWQDELYDLVSRSRAATSRLHLFGIVFGTDRVALIIEPTSKGGGITTNTARTTLLMNGEQLPWAEWAAEFRANLPQELKDLMEGIVGKTEGPDVRQNIKDRLKAIRDLFTLSRYRRAKGGSVIADPSSKVTTDEPVVIDFQVSPNPNPNPMPRPRPNRAGDIFAALAAAGEAGVAAEPVVVRDLPNPHWISKAGGTRDGNYLEDKAAEYLPETNKLMINADFRLFTDMENRWVSQFEETTPNLREAVRKVVQEWFTQQLIEAVMSAKALEGSPEWGLTELSALWSPTALTATVLPRYHVDREVGRILKGKYSSYLKDSRGVGTTTAAG
jgi:hypothetical protein